MSRTISILAWVVLAVVIAGAVVATARSGVEPVRAGMSGVWTSADVCAPGSASEPAEPGLLSFFTGGGSYMPRTHCLVTQEGGTDWPWVWALLGLNAVVIAGYMRIFVFWRRAYLNEQRGDRNTKLMDLAWIFLWCAVCGYAASVVMFFWPAYRLLALCLVPLAFFTWRFAGNLDDMRVSLSAKRLERELEESLRERNEELELAVLERTAELEMARAEAQAANEAKSAFVANISHEIRTPMAAILGYSELLDDPRVGPDEIGETAATIRRNGEHLLAVINDVLDLSKIESGQMNVERVECDPSRIASDVIGLLSDRAARKGIDLRLGLDASTPASITTDPTRLRQILFNLVGNAVKFTDEGLVRLDVRVDRAGDAGTLVCRVRDTGIGMDDGQMGPLFRPFQQVDGTMTRRFGGTGLGLSISRSLARQLGGDIVVTSAPGIGSEFVVTLDAGPISDAPAPDRCHRTVAPAAPGSRPAIGPRLTGRVLLVDDGEDNRRLARFHLQRAGLDVVEAADGREALGLVAQAARDEAMFDLVLMDIQMPGIDGLEATRRIKCDHPGVPVIALTAHALQDAIAQCRDAGCDEALTKPYATPELLEICRRWVETGRGRRAA